MKRLLKKIINIFERSEKELRVNVLHNPNERGYPEAIAKHPLCI